MKLKFLAVALLISALVGAQDKPAYRVFTSEGKKADYEDIIKASLKADVVFIGELHDDPIAHWLELEITKSIFAGKGNNLILGAEMFESDNQLLLNEYLGGIYDAAKFEAEVKLWKNYKTDYKPLVEFAKSNKLQFIATNVPRRYAALVNKSGFEGLATLSDEAKKLFAPLPFPYDPDVKCYKDMLNMGGMGGGQMSHGSENLPKAQALKDVTMAYFINKNLADGKSFIHYNGSYHSRNLEGIIWYLKKFNPDLKIVTIETVQQKDINSVEKDNLNAAGFIITIPDSMTRTY
ncbi:MAG: ChaN family lipoprotein [Bacteroidales bacterium]